MLPAHPAESASRATPLTREETLAKDVTSLQSVVHGILEHKFSEFIRTKLEHLASKLQPLAAAPSDSQNPAIPAQHPLCGVAYGCYSSLPTASCFAFAVSHVRLARNFLVGPLRFPKTETMWLARANRLLHDLDRSSRLLRTLITSIAREEDIKLFWPPPSGFTAAHPELSSVSTSGQEDGQLRQKGRKDQRKEPHKIAAEARLQSVLRLLETHTIHAPSLAKSNLAKLPADIVRSELQSWGLDTDMMLKPELVERMHTLLHSTTPAASSQRSKSEIPGTASQRQLVDMSISPQKVAQWLVDAKANNVIIIDVQTVCSFAEHLVLATGRSHRHVFTAASGVRWQAVQHLEEAQSSNFPHVEGKEGSDWVTVDVGRVVAHVFTEDARRLYNLEELWVRPNKVLRVSEQVQVG